MKKITFHTRIALFSIVLLSMVAVSAPHADAATCNAEADLSGQLGSNGSATVTNRSTTCSYQVGLASYKKFDENINNQTLFSSDVKTIGPNRSLSLSVSLPSCAYQLDVFYGNLITDYSTGARYGDRLLQARHAGGDYCGNNNFTVSCNVSDTSVTTGTTVSFTADAVGGTAPYTYQWSGTDGINGTTRTISKLFNSAGNKTATVIVRSGTREITKTCPVVVVSTPQADITGSCTASDQSINVGQSVTYTANANGGNNSFTYQWTGPEGLSSTNRVVDKTYNNAGTKTAQVQVTSNGRSITFVCPVVVVSQTSTPDISGSCDVNKTSARPGETVTYTAAANGGTGNFTYLWTGPENFSSTNNPASKAYTTEGTKTAQVRITSGNQSINKICPTVIIDDVLPFNLTCTASPTVAEVNDMVTFTARPTGGSGNFTYSWSGADGLTSTERLVSKTFSTAGTKIATVFVNDGTQTKSANCQTVIEQQTQGVGGQCTASPTTTNVGQSVSFSAQGTGGNGNYTYSWNGLENSFSSQSFNTTFSSIGNKNVTVNITSNGITTQRSCPVFIQGQTNNNDTLDIQCDVSPSRPEVDERVEWSVTVNGGDGNYTYRWTGDADGTSRTVYEEYNDEGEYEATIRVRDGQGEERSRVCRIDVEEDEEDEDDEDLDVSCSVSDSRVRVGDDVTFSARVDGGSNPYDYRWDIDDNGDEEDRTVRVSFDSPGRKYAEVTVEDDDGDEERARCSVLVEDDVTIISNPLPPPTQSYVYLNQVPYTGAGDTLKYISFAVMLAFWSIFVSYIYIRKRSRKMSFAQLQH